MKLNTCKQQCVYMKVNTNKHNIQLHEDNKIKQYMLCKKLYIYINVY